MRDNLVKTTYQFKPPFPKWLGGLFTLQRYGRQSRTERTDKRAAFGLRGKGIASPVADGVQVLCAIENLPSKAVKMVQFP